MMKVQKLNNTVSPFAGFSFVKDSINKIDMSHLIDS